MNGKRTPILTHQSFETYIKVEVQKNLSLFFSNREAVSFHNFEAPSLGGRVNLGNQKDPSPRRGRRGVHKESSKAKGGPYVAEFRTRGRGKILSPAEVYKEAQVYPEGEFLGPPPPFRALLSIHPGSEGKYVPLEEQKRQSDWEKG